MDGLRTVPTVAKQKGCKLIQPIASKHLIQFCFKIKH